MPVSKAISMMKKPGMAASVPRMSPTIATASPRPVRLAHDPHDPGNHGGDLPQEYGAYQRDLGGPQARPKGRGQDEQHDGHDREKQ
jgi:hypothetical protein